MIVVWCDITAPTFWWAELDTYKVGTVRNSCSFMHKGTAKPFELVDFSFDGCENEKTYDTLMDILIDFVTSISRPRTIIYSR